jgi:hypothetical protein
MNHQARQDYAKTVLLCLELAGSAMTGHQTMVVVLHSRSIVKLCASELRLDHVNT